ncbi:hypothetical protein A5821_003419 [Enterococcus sp. 7F3_DIV0205]|uniref:HTH cro/C1-type domain-containing protein n=1 Tax=Candidatus Enterococcus palustris TaxID=1834189 RepID=A0AAQ3Y8H7_9ENTE|nr:helix-turn-helix domain-containing protein [Enterococcus sp. 7F3_DIV0205]OTN84301.1 hypothetical protein A5821_000227 [Enterococcus sp. 7F3_DIV0205]
MVKSKITDIHISDYRTNLDMSLDDLASKVGVAKQTIANLEKNKHNPSLLLMYAISEELGTNIEQLVTFDKLPND